MNKLIFITGASSGIGEGIARDLAASGARLMLGARRTDRLDTTAPEIRAAGGTVETRALDVTDRHASRTSPMSRSAPRGGSTC